MIYKFIKYNKLNNIIILKLFNVYKILNKD